MRYVGDNWLELFTIVQLSGESIAPPRLPWAEGTVLNDRVKTIRAGNQIEVEAVPVWSTAPTGLQAKKSREAIRRANAENARKRFERKMNNNFTDEDYRIDLTYADASLPDARQARLDVSNYLRRVKYACQKRGLPAPQYMGVSEGKREGSRQKRIHHHLVLSCGLARSELESIWKKGRVRADHLQADRFGYTALARYMMKEPEGAKRYFCSRNLTVPIITTSDTKLSIRMAERIALDMEENAPVIFHKLYIDCEFVDCKVMHSDFIAGVYIYVRLRKNDVQKKHDSRTCSGGRKANMAEQMSTVGVATLNGTGWRHDAHEQGQGICLS